MTPYYYYFFLVAFVFFKREKSVWEMVASLRRVDPTQKAAEIV
jgi:hypothetical protein